MLAIVQLVSGIQMLGGALWAFSIAGTANTPEGQEALEATLSPWMAENAGTIFAIIGLAMLVIAVWSFVLARGYLKGHEKARRRGRRIALYAIVFAVLSIILVPDRTDPGSPWWTIIFNLTVYLYLGSERVMRFFKNK